MYLSGSFLGYDSFQYQPSLPSLGSYSSVTLYGGTAIIDKVKIVDYDMTNDELLAINPLDALIFDSSTLLAADFDQQTLDGGNIISLPSNITGWDLYRQDTSNSILKLISSGLPVSTTEYVDYTAQTGKLYQYEIFPKTDNAVGGALVTSVINTDFYGDYLVNLDGTEDVYLFKLNPQGGEQQTEDEVVSYNTYQEYNAYAIGKRNFVKLSISAVAGTLTIDDAIMQPVDYLLKLRNFIENGKIKYFKNRKGQLFAGITHGYKEKILDDGLNQQIYTVSFDFEECQAV